MNQSKKGVLKKKKLSKKQARRAEKKKGKRDLNQERKDLYEEDLADQINQMIDGGGMLSNLVANSSPEDKEKMRASLFSSMKMLFGCFNFIKRNKVLVVAMLLGFLIWYFA